MSRVEVVTVNLKAGSQTVPDMRFYYNAMDIRPERRDVDGWGTSVELAGVVQLLDAVAGGTLEIAEMRKALVRVANHLEKQSLAEAFGGTVPPGPPNRCGVSATAPVAMPTGQNCAPCSRRQPPAAPACNAVTNTRSRCPAAASTASTAGWFANPPRSCVSLGTRTPRLISALNSNASLTVICGPGFRTWR